MIVKTERINLSHISGFFQVQKNSENVCTEQVAIGTPKKVKRYEENLSNHGYIIYSTDITSEEIEGKVEAFKVKVSKENERIAGIENLQKSEKS